NVRAGFARVHTDEHMRCTMFALEIGAERAPSGIKSGVVQRWRAGDPANPVGSEQLFGHERKPVFRKSALGLVEPTALLKTSKELNTRKISVFAAGSADAIYVTGKSDIRRFRSPICHIGTRTHDFVNLLQECATVEHRSRTCPSRKRRHQLFASPAQISACVCSPPRSFCCSSITPRVW